MMKRKPTATTNKAPADSNTHAKLPFIEHLVELRRRLFYVALSILLWSGIAYSVEHHIINWLLAPSHGQQFVYTSVGGGIDFLFRVCLYTGIVFSLPVIIYQTLRYVQPLIGKHATRFIMISSLVSAVLAVAGILFGYYLGLPSALKFLLHQFHTADISALITIQSYFSFVVVYLLGSSLLFQVPLVIYLINRIKPLKISTLFKYERWVIVVSLVASAAINPSPRITDLAIIAVPMILSYQIGILIVWYTNKGGRAAKLQALLNKDAAVQAERQERLKTVQYVWDQSEKSVGLAPLPAATEPQAATTAAAARPHKAVVAGQVAVAAQTNSAKTSAAAAGATKPQPAVSRTKYVDGFIDLHRIHRRAPSV